MPNALEVDGARAPDHADHIVALFEQKFCQI